MKRRTVFYKRKNGLIAKKIKDEFIVIDPDTESFYVLNELGETIYRLLHKKRSLEEIIKKIVNEYAVLESKAANDIKDFLSNNNLIKKSL